MTLEQVENATRAVAASSLTISTMRDALEKIEKGVSGDEAKRIAFDALSECDVRDIIMTGVPKALRAAR